MEWNVFEFQTSSFAHRKRDARIIQTQNSRSGARRKVINAFLIQFTLQMAFKKRRRKETIKKFGPLGAARLRCRLPASFLLAVLSHGVKIHAW